jgi:hypothetical protein
MTGILKGLQRSLCDFETQALHEKRFSRSKFAEVDRYLAHDRSAFDQVFEIPPADTQ